jgi:hypothetical protein
MIYKIFTIVNFAETCRDKDDIQITELGYKKNLKDAKKVANDYIQEEFFRKETKLHKNKDNSFSATDLCSFGETIIIQPIIMD